MTTTTHTCDHCSSTITSDRHLLRVESGTLRSRLAEIDLCEHCFGLLTAWLAKGRELAKGNES